nr:glycosyltransferase family 4 protein [Dyella sp. ASV24]
MRILFLSTSYPSDSRDWRGVFIRHMVAGLARASDVKLLVWAPPGELPNNVEPAALPAESRWLDHLMKANGISHIMRSGGIKGLLAPIRLIRMIRACYLRNPDVDVYHINWLQCAIPLPNNRIPALITVLGNDLKLLRLPFIRSLVRRTMTKRKVALCPNADWMQKPLAKAFGDLALIVPTSFGIEPRWFAIERTRERGTPHHWIAVTRLTADKLGPLFQWSKQFFEDAGRELHLFGPMQEGISVPDWVHYHGAATPEELCNEWFPGATGLITLSRHAEGRPQVMLEAMAAGLPIIASDMPAHSSIVQQKQTGILCSTPEAYGNALAVLEEHDINQLYGDAARHWVRREMGTWDDCANRYKAIYDALLEESAHG